MPAPTGKDKTSLLACIPDARLAPLLAGFAVAGVPILTIYERPVRKTPDAHRYVVEVAGHVRDDAPGWPAGPVGRAGACWVRTRGALKNPAAACRARCARSE